MTSIPEFYAGRSIFVTGGTGFMGKVLCEKLLRSCSSIKKIYLLVRGKKGQDPHTRIEQMLQSKMFERLSAEQPDFKTKLEVVKGDILEPQLGLSEDDRQILIDNVSVVFHSAATVKFDEALKLSIQMNVIGVRSMLNLCKQMPKLEALVHVSTAYCNCNCNHIKEVVYPAPQDPVKVLQAMDWMSNEVVETLSPHLVKPRPNTYTFTKALAEHLLITECGDLPVSIIRPSIVGATWKEPLPGWVDNFNGPTGIFIGIGKGVLRTMEGSGKATADLIPCDIAANMFIAAAWYTALERPPKPQVFHCTTGQLNNLPWSVVEKHTYDNFMNNPLDNPARLPKPGFTQYRVMRNLYMIMDHFFPAWIMDVYSQLQGKKAVYVRLQTRLWKSVKCLEFFTSNTWVFDNDNYSMLLDKLSPDDRQTFNFDVKTIDWKQYLGDYCIGTKCYALKEDLKNLPKARRDMKRLQRWELLKNVLLCLFVWRLLVSRVPIIRRLWFRLVSLAFTLMKSIPQYIRA